MKKRPSDPALVVAAALFIAAGAVLLPMFRHQVNPDGLSYLAVAGHWLDGNWDLAVNGYWGPLLSWLLVPGLAVGLDPALAGKILGLAIGLIALWGLGRLAHVVGLEGRLRTAGLVSFVPALVLFALWGITPDLLMVAVFLHYLALLFGEERRFDPRTASWCGVLGWLAFVTKAYGLYVFLLHFTIVAFLRWLGAGEGRDRRRVALAWCAGIGMCLVLSSGWITALSAKYGGFTVSTTGPYNHALVGPESPGPPMEHFGFLAPANDLALSVWEDPSNLRLPAWSPLGSGAEIRHQLGLIAKNVKHIVMASLRFNPLSPLILVAVVVSSWRRWRRTGSGDPIAWLLLSMVIYPVGYVLVLTQTRYYWIVLLLMTLLGFALIARLARAGVWTRLVPWLAAAQMAIAILYPLWLMPYAIRTVQTDLDLPDRLREAVPVSGSLAASGAWVRGIALSHRLGMKYYGVRGDLADEDVLPRLRVLDVDWYVVWAGDEPAPEILESCPEVTGGSVEELRLYRIAGEG